MARDSDSDSDYAFRLQMEEALAASLSSQSRPRYTWRRPPSPPIVARTGLAIVEEDDRNSSRLKSNSNSVPSGFDFRKAIGEGTSKGKGRIHENTATNVRNPNIRVGNSQNSSGNDARRPSPVNSVGEGNSKGKGRIHENTATNVRNPNIRVGNSQNSSGNDARRLSPVNSVGEGSSKVNIAAGKFSGNVMYRLYFKGLVSEENGKGKGKMTDVVAGFGVAICDQRDSLLCEMKGPLIDPGMNRQGAEIKALTNGLAEALKMGIKHIIFCCDSFPIFQFITGKWMPKQKKISMLMDDLHRIRQQFSLSQPYLVAGNEVKFAYKLARESIVSQVTPHVDPRQAKASRKEECVICYNDYDADRMFSVDRCRHRFCFQCVKQHVEVKLLHGMFPKCPHDGCKSELVINACGKLLTTKLKEMWEQRIKENSIPVEDRVYCPYPKCSALMSKTKISKSAGSLMSVNSQSGARRCVECRRLFCVGCKVPWHEKLSCAEYKKLHPNPPADIAKLKSLANNKMWRQCGKCQHMIELTQGCNHITCRCGHEFCYNCGSGLNKRTGNCTKGCPGWNEANIIDPNPPGPDFIAPGNQFFFEDDDVDDYNDFEYDYIDYLRQSGHDTDGFDPFFDLPDGVLFTPDMLSPRSRQRFDLSDDDSDDIDLSDDDSDDIDLSDDDSDDMDHPPMPTQSVPANAASSREGQAEEVDQSHLSHTHAPPVNATPVIPPYQDLLNRYAEMHPGGDFMAGEYGDFYDSDEEEFDYDDYSDPFHPDYW